MSTEKKNPFKRDQALNDATAGQLGQEPSADPYRGEQPANKTQRKPKQL